MSRRPSDALTYNYKIGFLGGTKVGKTSILKQLVWKRFSQHYEPTLETDLDFVTEYKGRTVVCLLIDTCGSNDFPAMRNLCMSKSNAFIVVFSVADPASLETAKHTVTEIMHSKEENSRTILLVGNKTDLKRKVTSDEARQYCKSMNIDKVKCRYIEVCAKDHDDVLNMFHALLSMFPENNISESKTYFGIKPSWIKPFAHDFKEAGHNNTDADERLITRSPSLLSLNSFSSDEDISNCNYIEGKKITKRIPNILPMR
ncbi:ras-related protein RabC-like [Hydractinia symbiolongicarpus]|uniref:ras-related protein RabC-like n=1 Tax=Hydractinia symbiolongicarpus TaxID=13093 RepID=UPI00254FAF11|nr:ras-related protein RabC-like [Hydractinia symbiolongicarpus]XP_057298190.1 ras-related protein RabC-like [Hydractinia symbiolongicarpus]